MGSATATLAAHQPLALESGTVPQAAALVLIRATAGVVGYQGQTDGRGVYRALGGRVVPPQVGGSAPLSARLGGVVVAADARASVDVPLGALDADTAISIVSLSAETAPGAPGSEQVVVAAFQVSPPGVKFRQAVTLEFPVLQTARLSGDEVLTIYNPATKLYQPTKTVVQSGVGGTTLVASVTEFPDAGAVLLVLGPRPGLEVVPIVGGGGGGVVVATGGSGGVVSSTDGQVSVVIPPGAVPASTTIRVATVAAASLPAPGNSQSVLLAMQAEPSGLKFPTPVTVRFNVPPALQGRLPKQLPLQVYNPLTGKYEGTGFQAVLSADGTTLTASVTHFTIFVILQPFTPFASPIVKSGTASQPLAVASLQIPAPPASKLVFGQSPTTTTAGLPIVPAVTVQAQNILNNVDSNSTAAVTVGITSGTGTSGAVLSGTTTVNVVNGVATFAGLSIDVAGTGYTLTATSGSLTAGTSNPFNIIQGADLTLTKSHAGSFTQGQTGAKYTITVRNAGGIATSGSVTVTDTLPTGLTATAISGSGWTCTLGTLTCTRSDVLAASASYPAITVTVDVANNAPASITNTATVSGGGEVLTTNDTANDVTAVVQFPDLTVTKSHTGSFTQGQTGASYTIAVSNAAGVATSGSVTVTDTLPVGLTATAIGGSGWTCTLGTLTCTRSDALAASASFPAITLTVDVANNAAASITNTATVSGGGELITANDTANDVTTVVQLPDLTVTKSHTGNFTQVTDPAPRIRLR